MDSLIVFGAVIIGLSVFVATIYNGIVDRFNKVKRAWSDVIVQERQKDKIIPELERAVQDHNAYESSLLKDITALRSAMNSLSEGDIDTSKLADVENKTQDLLKGINVSIEAYPELKASELYNNLMVELTEQQENVGAAIKIFNSNVEHHNTGIESFPNNLVNNVLNKQKVLASFSDSETSNNFEFKPSL